MQTIQKELQKVLSSQANERPFLKKFSEIYLTQKKDVPHVNRLLHYQRRSTMSNESKSQLRLIYRLRKLAFEGSTSQREKAIATLIGLRQDSNTLISQMATQLLHFLFSGPLILNSKTEEQAMTAIKRCVKRAYSDDISTQQKMIKNIFHLSKSRCKNVSEFATKEYELIQKMPQCNSSKNLEYTLRAINRLKDDVLSNNHRSMNSFDKLLQLSLHLSPAIKNEVESAINDCTSCVIKVS